MKRKIQSVVAIDIGSEYVKIATGVCKNNHYLVKGSITKELPLSTFSDGKVTDELRLGELIRAAVKELKPKTKHAAITVNSSDILMREITIANVAEKEKDELIKLELKQVLPVDVEMFVIDYYVAEVIKNEGKVPDTLRLVIWAVPKTIVESLHTTLINADLQPVSMLLNPLSLYKVLSTNPKVNGASISEGVCVFVDIGYSTIDLNFVVDGVLGFTRSLPVGLKNIDEMLMATEDITAEQASTLRGTLTQDHMALSTTMKRWVSDIERIVEYHNKKVERKVEKIFLYGGGAIVDGLVSVFKQAIGVEAEHLASIDNIKSTNSLDIRTHLSCVGLLYDKKKGGK